MTSSLRYAFSASGGLFSVVFAELTCSRKRDFCPGSKRTVLSMRFGYLATEPSRDYASSLNDSGITVNECARDSGFKSQSANNTGSMRFVSVVHNSFSTQERWSLFLAPVSSANTTEKRPLLAGNTMRTSKETSLVVQYILQVMEGRPIGPPPPPRRQKSPVWIGLGAISNH